MVGNFLKVKTTAAPASVKVLLVASECFPLVKTGGLADVVGALPSALAPLGVDARVLMPAYRGVRQQLESVRKVATIGDLFGGIFGGAAVALISPAGAIAIAPAT